MGFYILRRTMMQKFDVRAKATDLLNRYDNKRVDI
jgi:hypothetical protein